MKKLPAQGVVREVYHYLPALFVFLLPLLPATGKEVAEEPAFPPVSSPSGSMTVIRDPAKEGRDTLEFRDPSRPPLPLDEENISWAGTYSFSPDEKWLLRLQKTGSGENMAILYHVEASGRVVCVTAFDRQMWAAAEKTGKTLKKDLFHTGMDAPVWSADHRTLTLTLRGGTATPGRAFSASIRYDLQQHVFTAVADGK